MTQLYKKDTKGKIRTLILTTEEDKLIQRAGLLEGKLVVNVRQCHPKNVGRANATTGSEQSLSELDSIVTKKLREGYFTTIEEANTNEVLLPMLAVKSDLTVIKYPILIQPKLDGMRAFGKSTKMISRKNKEIETLSHIDLTILAEEDILDGECYAHGLSFQDNMKLIKKYRKDETELVRYHVYDMPSASGGFTERYTKLIEITKTIEHVEVVPTYTVTDEVELLKYHDSFLEEGFEGTMVRIDGIPYEFNKRSKQLQKLKDFIDEAYKITDVIPSDRIPKHGVVVCITEDGEVFTCGMKMSHEQREDILINKNEVIGKMAEVRFFEYTDIGLPRFPVYYGCRLDK